MLMRPTIRLLQRISAGPPRAGEVGKLQAVHVPIFGSSKARKARASVTDAAAAATAVAAAEELTEKHKYIKESEDDAWALVSNGYGFRLKPEFHSWRTFLAELRRFEWRWRLVDDSGAFLVTITDHGLSRDDEAVELLSWRCATQHLHGMTMLLDGLLHLLRNQESSWPPLPLTFPVGFVDDLEPGLFKGMRKRELEFRCRPRDVHLAGGSDGSKRSHPATVLNIDVTTDDLSESQWERLRRGRRMQSSALLPSVAPATGDPKTGGSVPPLPTVLFAASAQGMTYAVLTSIVRMLESHDLAGTVPNRALFDYDALAEAEKVWHELRVLACLHPSPWPLARFLLGAKRRTS